MPATAEGRVATVTPIRGRTSILPAAVVLIIAVGTLAFFTVLNVLLGTNGSPQAQVPVIVGGLPIARHATVFEGWVQGGAPPANIASGLIVPVGAHRVGSVATGGGGPGSSAYDLADRIAVAAPRARVLGFYRSDMEALGWTLESMTVSPHGTAELLFQKGGADGFYWEAGVDATATSPTATTYTYRLFQAADYS